METARRDAQARMTRRDTWSTDLDILDTAERRRSMVRFSSGRLGRRLTSFDYYNSYHKLYLHIVIILIEVGGQVKHAPPHEGP